jgi:demethylmenaquinone methyltransferase/2-methoxy-6-polyprenyl-1,4-benzoquinol methylase
MPAVAQTRDGSGAMFDGIAPRYDLLNRLMSLGMDHGWRRKLVDALGPRPLELLDLATGTGDVALALARRYPAARVVGLDPSPGMLHAGVPKLAESEGRVTLVQGDAQVLPFRDGRFDGACISFGIRNVPDRQAALREMARVTRPGCPVAILELGEPQEGLLAPFARMHIRHVVPTLGALISGAREYRYLAKSVAAFPPPDAFAALMREAGLQDVSWTPLNFGVVHLYRGLAPYELP